MCVVHLAQLYTLVQAHDRLIISYSGCALESRYPSSRQYQKVHLHQYTIYWSFAYHTINFFVKTDFTFQLSAISKLISSYGSASLTFLYVCTNRSNLCMGIQYNQSISYYSKVCKTQRNLDAFESRFLELEAILGH